ncbi:glycosyltransferase family 39 protein [Bacteroidota bacterium]
MRKREDIKQITFILSGAGKTEFPSTFLMARSLTALFSLLSVIMVFFICIRFFNNPNIGLLSALFLAVSPTAITNGWFITVNSFLVFAVLLVVWFSFEIFKKGRLKDYILAGIMSGLAISFKYTGAVTIVIFITAHFLNKNTRGLKDIRLYNSLAIIPITFFILNPYTLFELNSFISAVYFEFTHYSTGHAGMEGNSFIWYISYLWKTEGFIMLLAVIEIIYSLIKRNKSSILLSSFIIVYFIFICSFSVRNDRTILPIIPLLILFGSMLVYRVYQYFSLKKEQNNIITKLVMIIVIVALLYVPVLNTVARGIKVNTKDSRETSRVWINNNILPLSRIAMESYSPYIDPDKYKLFPITSIIDNEPDWYIKNDIHFLVLSHGMYGRFLSDPERYSLQKNKYERFFSRFSLFKFFNDGGYEIRIYKVEENIFSLPGKE